MAAVALNRSDFAALRAYVQGLEAGAIGERYLAHLGSDDTPPDARVVASHLRACMDALIMRAYQHDLFQLAQVLDGRHAASNRAIERAVDAITQLERRGEARPSPKHSVSMWFAPSLARRLQGTGLNTIGELVDRCNVAGHAWWRAVPRVGATAAAAIVAWLAAHSAAISAAGGRKLRAHAVDRAARSQATELVPAADFVPPLELMRVAPALDGSAGVNRGRGAATLAARNDYEAVVAWLRIWPEGSNTRRAYRKEAERFLAWSVVARGKPMSSLLFEDCLAYREFLANPQPEALWCGPMRPRFSPLWRPFSGPLAPRSIALAITVLRGLCEWLRRQNYLAANPFDGLPRASVAVKESTEAVRHRLAEKALSAEAWVALEKWLGGQATPPTATAARTSRAVVLLLRDTGLRIDELRRADRARATATPNVAPELWGELLILGKRDRDRAVPLSMAAVDALRAHWRDRGEDFDTASAGPLVRPALAAGRRAADPTGRFSASGLHRLVTRVAKRFAEARPDLPSVDALTAHALRHTFGVHAKAMGMPDDVLQAILGHTSPATTALYTTAPGARRRREAARFFAADPQTSSKGQSQTKQTSSESANNAELAAK